MAARPLMVSGRALKPVLCGEQQARASAVEAGASDQAQAAGASARGGRRLSRAPSGAPTCITSEFSAYFWTYCL
jgi:hypothetical protein